MRRPGSRRGDSNNQTRSQLSPLLLNSDSSPTPLPRALILFLRLNTPGSLSNPPLTSPHSTLGANLISLVPCLSSRSAIHAFPWNPFPRARTRPLSTLPCQPRRMHARTMLILLASFSLSLSTQAQLIETLPKPFSGAASAAAAPP